jgi:hypothetical protein
MTVTQETASEMPGTSDDDECQDIVARIGQDFPDWLVIWGTYTRQFVAFPLFAAPPGAFVTANRPGALITRMRNTERTLGKSPGPTSRSLGDDSR